MKMKMKTSLSYAFAAADVLGGGEMKQLLHVAAREGKLVIRPSAVSSFLCSSSSLSHCQSYQVTDDTILKVTDTHEIN